MQTILLSLTVVPLGLVGGIILALLSTVKHPLVRWPLMAWVDTFRALPPLVLLVFVYAGLPFAGLEVPPGPRWRSASSSTPAPITARSCAPASRACRPARWRRRAAPASRAARPWRYVILPQAVRNVLPDLISNTLEVVKLTSIASVVALPELLFQARQAQSVTYNATPIVAAAVIYFLLLWPLVRVLSRLENRQLAGRG